MTCRASNIWHLALYRNILPTPTLQNSTKFHRHFVSIEEINIPEWKMEAVLANLTLRVMVEL